MDGATDGTGEVRGVGVAAVCAYTCGANTEVNATMSVVSPRLSRA